MTRYLAVVLLLLSVAPAWASDSSITVPTGQKLDTEQVTVAGQPVQRQRVQLCGATDTACTVIDPNYGARVNLRDTSGNAISSILAGSTRGIAVTVVDGSGNQVTTFGGAGGTASNFGSAVPSQGTAMGASDGTNMQMPRAFDADTGGGTQYVLGAILRKSASGGSVEAGTSTDPLRIDPTGTTAQPASQSGNWTVRNQDGSGNSLTSRTSGASRPLEIAVLDASGNQITAFGGTPSDTVGSTVALNALNAAASVALAGQQGAEVFIASGTLAGTITCEVTRDATTTWEAGCWFVHPTTGAVAATEVFTNPNAATSRGIVWLGPVTHVRVRVSSFTSGTANGTLRATTNSPHTVIFGWDGSKPSPLNGGATVTNDGDLPKNNTLVSETASFLYAEAVAHGSNPTAVAAGNLVGLRANRHGIPFVAPGHPNMQTVRATYTAAQTDTAVVTVSGGTKIVVTASEFTCSKANSVNVSYRLGFGTANTPTTTGVVSAHPNIEAGSGVVKGNGAGILGIGADGEDLRITISVPTSGACDIVATYYTVDS